jgi:hypothetical protein
MMAPMKVSLLPKHKEAIAMDAQMLKTTPAKVLAAILSDFFTGWGSCENRRIFYNQVIPKRKP